MTLWLRLAAWAALAGLSSGSLPSLPRDGQLARLADIELRMERLRADFAGVAGGQEIPRRLDDAAAVTTPADGAPIVADGTVAATFQLPTEVTSFFDGAFEVLASCMDHLFLIICGSMVMFMQAGFAFLEAGAIRARSAKIVLLKNIGDACVAGFSWYLLGYAFAHGSGNSFIGTEGFAGDGFMQTDGDDRLLRSPLYLDWFFQSTFSATAGTIVSGAVAERIHFGAYMACSIMMSAFIYPVVVHWAWHNEGWLKNGDVGGNAYHDFAGSGVVHLVGGFAGLVGAIMVGSREGRWDPLYMRKFESANLRHVAMGTFFLWFGWYGFNCGSVLTLHSKSQGYKAGLVAMNMTLSGATGGIVAFVLRMRKRHELDVAGMTTSKATRKFDLGAMCNGILAGMVSICAGASSVSPPAAIGLGFIGAVFHEIGHLTTASLQIDDPVDAFAVHGCAGLAGVLFRPLFDINGAKGGMFGTHVVAVLALAGWSMILAGLVFLPFKLTNTLHKELELLEEDKVVEAGEEVAEAGEADGQTKRSTFGGPSKAAKEKAEAAKKKMQKEEKYNDLLGFAVTKMTEEEKQAEAERVKKIEVAKNMSKEEIEAAVVHKHRHRSPKKKDGEAGTEGKKRRRRRKKSPDAGGDAQPILPAPATPLARENSIESI